MKDDSEDVSITRLLGEAVRDPRAREEAYLALKAELKTMAERQMIRTDEGSVEASHVVNHVFVKLTGTESKVFPDRERFFAYAFNEIRTFLVDKARARRAAKRGKGQIVADLAQVGDVAESANSPAQRAELNDELLKLNRVLPLLEQSDPELHVVVLLYFFADLTFEQIGLLLAVDPGTARRRWERARLILQREMMNIDPNADLESL